MGLWTQPPAALPASQLPSVPLLGNGALGILLDGHGGNSSTPGPGSAQAIDAWLSSSAMWSCGACAQAGAPGGCCRAAALGGVTLSLLRAFPPAQHGALGWRAEQDAGAGVLRASLTTAAGGVFLARYALAPVAGGPRVVVVNFSWTPGSGDPAVLPLDVSLWVVRDGGGGGPAPALIGCASPTDGRAATCDAGAAGGAQMLVAARNATSGARLATSPRAVRAGLAVAIVGAGAAPRGYTITSAAAGAPWEARAAIDVTAGAPAAVVVAEAEDLGAGGVAGEEPGAAAAAALATALATGSAGAAADAAASWWAAFNARSAVSLPSRPAVEAVWAGAQYALAATSADDVSCLSRRLIAAQASPHSPRRLPPPPLPPIHPPTPPHPLRSTANYPWHWPIRRLGLVG